MKQNRKRREAGRHTANVIFWRTLILMGIFGVAIFIPLGVKLYHLQITRHEELQRKATNQQTRDVSVSASRGNIYDANGNVLAVSATVYDVILSPKDINTVSDADMKAAYGDNYKTAMTENQIATAQAQIIKDRIDLIATNLSQILDVDADDIRERCDKVESQYSLVKKKVETETETSVRSFIEKYKLSSCIYLTTNTKRYYPYSTLAAQVVGFVNSDNQGTYGVELEYDDVLSGTEGRIVTAKNNVGTDLLYYYSEYYDASDGDSVSVTIDSTIQAYCEETLEEGVKKYQAEYGGWCIAMDPNTGEIKGIATSPTYDLNDPSAIYDESLQKKLDDKKEELEEQVSNGELTQEEADEQYNETVANARFEQWTSKAVNSTYEPGSTFKSIVLASALEEGVISETDYFNCLGKTELDGWTIRCSNHNGHGSQSLAQAVGNSCNMAFMQIGDRLDPQTYWDYLEAFGITERTGVDMPSEGIPQLWAESEFVSRGAGIVDRAVASFGQRFTLNPIQLVTAFSATINGGYLYKPHVVKSVADEEGNTVVAVNPTVVRQVISEDTSATVRKLLEYVVTDGGGSNAYQAGYRIGGKTGTSQVSGKANEDRYVVSFIGFAPADDPQIVVLLAFDGPKVDHPGVNSSTGACGIPIYGGKMAAPLAGELIAEICDYLGVNKQYTAEEAAKADSTVPYVIDLSETEAASLLESANLTYHIVGDGEKVTAQVPAAGVTLSNSSDVTLYMGAEVSTETVTMPDLSNLSPSNAEYKLEQLGLYYKGSGQDSSYFSYADSQSVEAGTEVTVGTVVTVHFSDSQVENVE